ncbi:MFS transporter [Anaerotignum sp.]|nr:MFS transporter [Anaerotignum sp.]MBQ7757961.1 MFS transporter [Anaerotignum sp.]
MLGKEERRRNLTITILSLSLLTVMAGAAVAPALDYIKTYFSGVDQTLVQMIISIPSLFMALTNFIFPKLCKIFKARTLLLGGLALYVVGGCAAGLFSNIYIVLVFRAIVGIGAGIIMPMSTGLLSFYYTRDKQDRLMGYSSAMNQMGGVFATLVSGFLASFSWRASFLVYLMGVPCAVLVMMHLPNEKIAGNEKKKEAEGVFGKYYMFLVAIFLSMFTFFVYPSVFAIQTVQEGIINPKFIPIIMACMDLVAFLGGLSFVHLKKALGIKVKFAAPLFFFIGYTSLFLLGGWVGAIIGSVFIGFANGVEIPFVISTASQRAGRAAGTTVVPMISFSMYMAQFVTPMILNGVSRFVPVPYAVAAISAALLIVWSVTIKADIPAKHVVIQEK